MRQSLSSFVHNVIILRLPYSREVIEAIVSYRNWVLILIRRIIFVIWIR